MEAVLFDNQFAKNIGCARVVRWTVISISVTGNFHGTGNVAQLENICELFRGPVFAFGDVLHQDRRVSWEPESL